MSPTPSIHPHIYPTIPIPHLYHSGPLLGLKNRTPLIGISIKPAFNFQPLHSLVKHVDFAELWPAITRRYIWQSHKCLTFVCPASSLHFPSTEPILIIIIPSYLKYLFFSLCNYSATSFAGNSEQETYLPTTDHFHLETTSAFSNPSSLRPQ